MGESLSWVWTWPLGSPLASWGNRDHALSSSPVIGTHRRCCWERRCAPFVTGAARFIPRLEKAHPLDSSSAFLAPRPQASSGKVARQHSQQHCSAEQVQCSSLKAEINTPLNASPSVAPLVEPKRAFWVKPSNQEAYLRAVELGFPILVEEDDPAWKGWIQRALSALLLLRTDLSPGQVRERDTGRVCATYHRLQTAEDVHRLESALPEHTTMVVHTVDWKLIPVENLVSLAYRYQSRLLVVVSDTETAAAQLASLERGVHGVVLATDSASSVERFATLRERHVQEATVLPLEEATVQAVQAAGIGERVCLDTCSLLAPHEGLLIGSNSSVLALVLSEAARNDYVESRPFRVNAGAVHSYILQPDGSTRYLCELRAGNELLVVDARSGKTRIVTLGRAKIERRPLLLVQLYPDGFNDQHERATIILQNAETVRLATAMAESSPAMNIEGAPVTALIGGQHRAAIFRPVQGDDEPVARHLGRPVKEFIREL